MSAAPDFNRLLLAIGEALAQHVSVEHLVHDICLAAAWVADPNVSGDRAARQVLHVALLNNSKIGDKIKSCQAILYIALGDTLLFREAIGLLDEVERLSRRRNRFAHDMWDLDQVTGQPSRHRMLTKLSRPENAPWVVADMVTEPEPSIEAVEQLARALRHVWERLVEVENALAGLATDPG